MTPREVMVVLEDPNGTRLDVSDRLSRLGDVDESLEGDELVELVHSDIDLELDDADGGIAGFVENAQPGDEYRVEVWRETGERRPKWALEFAGILDLPWSIQYDDADHTVSFQVFGLSKLLEHASAEAVARSVTGRTGTVSMGSPTITVTGGTTDFEVGDEITLADDTNSETHTIVTVGGSTLDVDENFGVAFTDAMITLDTPYHRNHTVESLAGDLFEEAGITDYDVEAVQLSALIPFGSRSHAAAADDWTKVNANAHDFTLDTRETAPKEWELWLQDNAVDVVMVDSFTDTEEPTIGYDGEHDIEYDPTEDRVWVSFRRPATNYRELVTMLSDGSSQSVVFSGVDSAGWGELRRIYGDVDRMAYTSFPTALSPDRVILFLHLSTPHVPSLVLAIAGETPGNIAGKTIATLDGARRAAALYTLGGYLYLRVWEVQWGQSQTLLLSPADYLIAEGSSLASASSGTYDTGTEFVYWGQVGSPAVYFQVSRSFGGVIPYADFEGLSCGAALRELAVVTASFVTVDQFGAGLFAPRSSVTRDRTAEELPDPLRRRRIHLTSLYRDSVKVSGERPDGVEFEIVVGARSDPSRQLEIESPLIVEEALAEAVGNAYVSLLSAEREEHEVVIDEPVPPLRPLDRVSYDGQHYDVLSASTDLVDREQQVRLVRVP